MACPLKAMIERHNEHFKVANGLKRISALMYQLLCGINYLHENSIVHGVRLECKKNFLLTRAFRCYLLEILC
jgi:hypothetical protein